MLQEQACVEEAVVLLPYSSSSSATTYAAAGGAGLSPLRVGDCIQLQPGGEAGAAVAVKLSERERADGGSNAAAEQSGGRGGPWQITSIAVLPHTAAVLLGTATGELIGLQRVRPDGDDEEGEHLGNESSVDNNNNNNNNNNDGHTHHHCGAASWRRWTVAFVQRVHNGGVYDVTVCGVRVASAGHDAVCCVTTWEALSAAYTPNRLCGYGIEPCFRQNSNDSSAGESSGPTPTALPHHPDAGSLDEGLKPVAPPVPLWLGGHSLPIVQLRFTSDGSSLISLSIDGHLRVTHLRVGAAMNEAVDFPCGLLARCFVLSADETMVYVGGEGGLVRVDLAAPLRPASEAAAQRWEHPGSAASAEGCHAGSSWLRRSESSAWAAVLAEEGGRLATTNAGAPPPRLCVTRLRLVPPGALVSSSLSDSRLEATVVEITTASASELALLLPPQQRELGTLVWDRAEDFCKAPSRCRPPSSPVGDRHGSSGTRADLPSDASTVVALPLLYKVLRARSGPSGPSVRNSAFFRSLQRCLPGLCAGRMASTEKQWGTGAVADNRWSWPLEDQRTTVLQRSEHRSTIAELDAARALLGSGNNGDSSAGPRDNALRTTQETVALLEAEKNRLQESCAALVRAIKNKRVAKKS